MECEKKAAIIALLKSTLLFIFIYTHPFMQFVVLALWSSNKSPIEAGESSEKVNLSQHKPRLYLNYSANVFHYNSVGTVSHIQVVKLLKKGEEVVMVLEINQLSV